MVLNKFLMKMNKKLVTKFCDGRTTSPLLYQYNVQVKHIITVFYRNEVAHKEMHFINERTMKYMKLVKGEIK